MSLRLEMLQAARVARKALGESAQLVRAFVRAQQNPDGGFKDRTGRSDLYYTVFGLDALTALQVETPRELARQFLRQFGGGEGLDLVHLCCLARAWAAVGGLAANDRAAVLRRLETFRTADGGYSQFGGSRAGTAYGCFLALGAGQDLQAELPAPLRLAECLGRLETADGAWSNAGVAAPATRAALPSDAGLKLSPAQLSPGAPPSTLNPQPSTRGATLATAAAMTVLRQLGQPVKPSATAWLLARAHPKGGFVAAPDAPLPDLLSTATALHALAAMQVRFDHLKERCLDFLDSLWTNEGGFYGHWADEHLDCEYTFYGLLALGHLA
jgi:hypothetical protein